MTIFSQKIDAGASPADVSMPTAGLIIGPHTVARILATDASSCRLGDGFRPSDAPKSLRRCQQDGLERLEEVCSKFLILRMLASATTLLLDPAQPAWITICILDATGSFAKTRCEEGRH
jgi:hypothetical protein